MVDFPNPRLIDINNRDHLVTQDDAARAARVKPDTIRIWVRRNKVEPLPIPGRELYYLPVILAASRVRSGRPRKAPPPVPDGQRAPRAA